VVKGGVSKLNFSLSKHTSDGIAQPSDMCSSARRWRQLGVGHPAPQHPRAHRPTSIQTTNHNGLVSDNDNDNDNENNDNDNDGNGDNNNKDNTISPHC
jgi:hypothetical protein